MDFSFLAVVVVTLVLGLGSQAIIKGTFKKWSKVPASSHLSGAQAAQKMLQANGLNNVTIQKVGGDLSDHFDPRTNSIALSESVFDGRSVASIAVACHEAGHAVQHAQKYVPSRIRGAFVPVVSIASNAWMFVLIAGVMLNIMGLYLLAIGLYVAVIAFQLMTLPVEFNASSRALAYIRSYGYLPPQETKGAGSVLRAAAFTYVAAALASLLYLLHLLSRR